MSQGNEEEMGVSDLRDSFSEESRENKGKGLWAILPALGVLLILMAVVAVVIFLGVSLLMGNMVWLLGDEAAIQEQQCIDAANELNYSSEASEEDSLPEFCRGSK